MGLIKTPYQAPTSETGHWYMQIFCSRAWTLSSLHVVCHYPSSPKSAHFHVCSSSSLPGLFGCSSHPPPLWMSLPQARWVAESVSQLLSTAFQHFPPWNLLQGTEVMCCSNYISLGAAWVTWQTFLETGAFWAGSSWNHTTLLLIGALGLCCSLSQCLQKTLF